MALWDTLEPSIGLINYPQVKGNGLMATQREKERKKIRYSDAKEVAQQQDEGFTPKSFTLPDGVSQFRFRKEKTYTLDIIPFFVGDGNPRADKGMVHFERTYYTHRNIGPNNDSYVCLNKNFGKKCPICQFRAKLAMEPKHDKELVKALSPKERQLWLVIDHDEREKGIQVMETPHYKGFGELLKAKTKAGDDEAPYQNFHHLDDGFTLKVTVEEDSWQGKSYMKPTNIEMRPRKKPLSPTLLDEAPCLDDLVVPMDYNELKEIFMQTTDDDDEPEDGDEAEDEDDDSGEEDGRSSSRPSRKASNKSTSSSKKSSKQKDEDDEEEDDTEDDDAEDVDESEEDDEEPEDAPEGDEEEDTEEEEEEEEVEIEKGDLVAGIYKKKSFKGRVTLVQKRKGKEDLLTIKTLKGNTRVMAADEVDLIKKSVKKQEEVEEEEEEEKPAKKPSSSSKPSSKKPLGKGGKKKEEDDDDDDDLPFDEDDLEEDDEE